MSIGSGSSSRLLKKLNSNVLSSNKTSNSSSYVNSSPEQILRQMSNENTARTFEFNASEADKARDFSEYMSNTSHQREVEDLKRAGLNPVLSANGGAQAYSAASASGTADSSAVGVLASIYQTKLNNDNAVKIAKMNNENNKEIARINAQASKYASDKSSSASKYASDNSLYGTQYGVDRSKYGMVDNFVSGLLGNDKKSNTASKVGNLGKKFINWSWKQYNKPRNYK